jgi:uncharacterized protein (DUF2062 family)
MRAWLRQRIVGPLLAFLQQGMSPERLAACVAVAIVVGNIPILGVSTVLCTAIALAFRLNLAAIQLVQWLMAPTQVLLIIPFVRLGEWLLRDPREPLTITAALALMSQGFSTAIRGLGVAIAHASLAWTLIAPFVMCLVYAVATPLFRQAASKLR